MSSYGCLSRLETGARRAVRSVAPILIVTLSIHFLASASLAQQTPTVTEEAISGTAQLGSAYVYQGNLALGRRIEELQNGNPGKKVSVEILSKTVKEKKHGSFTTRQLVYSVRFTIS